MSVRKFLGVVFFLFILNDGYSQLVINEFQASNTNDYLDPHSETYIDWIELYNSSASDIDLSGYFISDNPTNHFKYTLPVNTIIPANGYLIMWADGTGTGLHTNFKLSSGGEYVLLSNNLGVLLDSISFSDQMTDVSYGRVSDGDPVWGYFPQSTPNASNTTFSSNSISRANSPIINTKGGFYSSGFSVVISGNNIVYTLDGSEPDRSSQAYNGPISIDSTTVLRARSISPHFLDSKVVTETYFVNESTKLPVLAISTAPDNLWNDTTGIYADGINYDPLDFFTANYYNDWQKPANLEYYTAEGVQELNMTLEYKLIGELRNYPVKSFRLTARSKYDNDVMDYNFFPGRTTYDQSKSILVRHGGWPDLESSLFRDGLIHTLGGEDFNLDYQAYQPCLVFYNGEYFGIHNIREKINEDYLADLHGVEPGTVDILENYQMVVEGDALDYSQLLDFITNNNMRNDSLYQKAISQIDIDEYLNYIILQIYVANTDWPDKNIKYWKPKDEEGKWRWIVFDTDFGLGLRGKEDHNTVRYMADPTFLEGHNPLWSTELFRNLLENEGFKNKFIQRFNLLLSGGIFSPKKALIHLDSIVTNIKPEVKRHASRWSHFKSYRDWLEEVEQIRKFIINRPDNIRSYLETFFNLGTTYHFDIQAREWAGGYFDIEGVVVDSIHGVGEFHSGIPFTVKAIAKPGYRFVGWEGVLSNSSSLEISLDKDSLLIARFESTGEQILPEIISENTTLREVDSPFLINSDLIVPENITLTVEPGVVFKVANKANIIVYGNVFLNGDKDNEILLEPNYEAGFKEWGAIVFLENTDSSSLNYVEIIGATNGHDLSRDKAAISGWKTTISINHCVIVDVENQPIFAQVSNVYLTNSKIHSKVTGDLINVKGGFAYIDSCEFIGNNKVDTDAIDYDGIINGVIKNSIIHSFTGGNSDGIDLGEGSKNIIAHHLVIYDCTDKGVSIGQASSGIMVNNVIYACDMGVGVKDSNSVVLINKNTFYGNNIGVAAFEKNSGKGGGNAIIANSIISNSVANVSVDNLSLVSTSYSLIDDELISGVGNLVGDPQFVNTALSNFELELGSPAIDNGDPNSPLDLDNTRTDIGADYKHTGLTTLANIYINEFVASNTLGYEDEFGEADDWIEIYNDNDLPVDIGGLYITDSLLNPTHWKIKSNSPKSTRVPAKGFLLLWADQDTLQGAHHINMKLSKDGEQIGLSQVTNADTVWLDSLTYTQQLTDKSFGRERDGQDDFKMFDTPSPLMSNNPHPPVILSDPNIIGNIGIEYRYDILVEDADNDMISISIDDVPSWLSFVEVDNGKAILMGTPQLSDSGDYVIKIVGDDGSFGHEVEQSYILKVIKPLEQEKPIISTKIVDVFPNPVQDKLILQLINRRYKELEIAIFNTMGQRIDVSDLDFSYSNYFETLDVSQLLKGTYIIRIYTDGFDIQQSVFIKY